MRKGLCLGIVLALMLSLCACKGVNPAPTDGTVSATQAATHATAPAVTEAPVTVPVATEPPVTEPQAPEHSAIYLPDYTADQIWEYFEEVVLHTEYSTGDGNTALVQKWNAPLRYRITGQPTDEDLAVLENCFAQLNTVPGFPGIYPAEAGELSNLNIGFMNPTDFKLAFSAFLQGEEANGAAQFWYYTATNEIHTANIGYRTDVPQETRSSILVEEIINTLGISDTVLRTDSIVYQYSDENLVLSDVDWTILKLLYDPAIQCGMDFDQCRGIIPTLYY